MALQGFGPSSEAVKSKKPRAAPGTSTSRDVPSTSVLLTTEKGKQVLYIFCKATHESKECEVSRKMELSERKEYVKRENGCFVCIR